VAKAGVCKTPIAGPIPAVASVFSRSDNGRVAPLETRGGALKTLLGKYAPSMAFTGGAVPTMSIVGTAAVNFLDELEEIEPELRAISKRHAPNYAAADVAILSRPLFNPGKFAVGIYAWPEHTRYLTEDLILGSSGDGTVIYHSGAWPGMPDSDAWRNILELGDDAAPTGDFGARPVGTAWFFEDHRNPSPSSTQYDADVWAELLKARSLARSLAKKP
jgi:hypothetical protein